MNPSKIAIIGSGYVGLVVASCFAEHGRFVTSVDKDQKKINALKSGEIPFYEPGLDILIKRNQRDDRLTFTTDIEAAIRENDVIMLAVGTPPGGDGQTDLSQVLTVAETIGKNLDHEALVVLKSTVPVGTTQLVKRAISEITDVPVHVAFNPEFLREGDAVEDFMHPARTVVGVEDDAGREILEELYAPFFTPQSPLVLSDIASAEMTKYAANAMLATKISFMNDIALLCERVGADVEMIKKGIGLDRRIGERFLNPGVGFGGSCFPKDLRSLIYTASTVDEDLPILRSVVAVNERMRQYFVEKVEAHFDGDLSGRSLAIWGLAFKPNTDDMREAPAIDIIEALHNAGAHCKSYDPEAMDVAQAIIGDNTEYHQNAYSPCHGVDALLVLTEWNEFRSPDWERLKKLMASPVVFDGRNIYDPDEMQRRGFTYYSIGRPTRKA